MPEETMTFEDIPASDSPFAQTFNGSHLLRDDIYAALARIARIPIGMALMITNAPPGMRGRLASTCGKRWPGIQIIKRGHTIIVIPPQNGSA